MLIVATTRKFSIPERKELAEFRPNIAIQRSGN